MNRYRPDRKIVAAAAAAIIVWLIQGVAGVEVPIGIEGAIATIVGYLVPASPVHVAPADGV